VVESSAAQLKRAEFKCERTKISALEFMPNFHKKMAERGPNFTILHVSSNGKLNN
jgi:hypothetical protein